MNTISKFALLMLLLATISSITHTIHLDEEYRLELTDDNQFNILKGDGEGLNRCPISLILCHQHNEDWRIQSLHYCWGMFPQDYIISGAQKDQEREELIELSKTRFYGMHSTCKLDKETKFLK
jgi:hypothetical protein